MASIAAKGLKASYDRKQRSQKVLNLDLNPDTTYSWFQDLDKTQQDVSVSLDRFKQNL